MAELERSREAASEVIGENVENTTGRK